jgi:hypothetical protein
MGCYMANMGCNNPEGGMGEGGEAGDAASDGEGGATEGGGDAEMDAGDAGG